MCFVEVEIGVKFEQIVLVLGIMQVIDLILWIYMCLGDVVIVGDFVWFQMFGCFVVQGVQFVGMLYMFDGFDLDVFEILVQMWWLKMFVINMVLQNLIGMLLLVVQVFWIFKFVEVYDFLVVEDDIYGDLCLFSYLVMCFVSFDQLKCVIYFGSYLKMFVVNLWVGYVVCVLEIVKVIIDQKMLVGMIMFEFNECVLYKILIEGYYWCYVEWLCVWFDGVCDKIVWMFECIGFGFFMMFVVGMFLWVDMGVDLDVFVVVVYEVGFLLMLGSLFLLQQLLFMWMCFNVVNCGDLVLLGLLVSYIDLVVWCVL